MQCNNCEALLPEEDVFCEECGVRLEPEPVPPRPEGAREELILSAECAAITDVGCKRSRNEDRFAVRHASEGWALVVCDGVSSSEDSQRASAIAAEQTAERLSLYTGTKTGQIMREAIADAARAVAQLPKPAPDTEDPASTTLVAAFVQDRQVTIGWLGDSRAYWFGAEGGARQLTSDHSWLNEVVASGKMTADEAGHSPTAHAITKWIGADSGEMEPGVVEFYVEEAGTLLLCTDGLWNYAPESVRIRDLLKHDGDAITEARKLVDFALASGGHDNVTVAILRFCIPEESAGDASDPAPPQASTTGNLDGERI
jgi:serine/threonine protein phosphatase PrpC